MAATNAPSFAPLHFPAFPRVSSSSIPLRCNICPRNPEFSDISHLLTHIASKGHLSTYYKIKVQSGSDDAARQLIDEYDAWYATWGIESLMSDRMNMKEKKRRQKTVNETARSDLPRPPRAMQYYGPQDTQEAHHLDPLLAHHQLPKVTSYAGGTLESEIPRVSGTYEVPVPLPAWIRLPAPFHPRAGQTEDYLDDRTEEVERPYESQYRLSPLLNKFHVPVEGDDGPSSVNGDADDANGDAATKGQTLEYARLKGVLWPGMAIFDSATPEMRRKRNQKKSIDVIDRLEAASREIEATEIVYSAGGFVEKERPITGFPHSDSSPMKALIPPTPTKTRRAPRKTPAPRKALATRDVNVQARGNGRARGRRSTRMTPTLLGPDDQPDEQAQPARSNKRGRKSKTKGVVVPAEHQVSQSLPAVRSHPGSVQDGTMGRFRDGHFPTARTNEDQLLDSVIAWNDAPSGGATYGTATSAWDFLGQELGCFLANPMFIDDARVGAEPGDDDDRTVSAPLSEH